MLRDVLQQARYIEGHHLMHSRTAHTVVSQADRRMLEGPMSSMIANLETSEVRSEDATSAAVAHTEMTREGNPVQEFMVLMSRHGIPDEQALELFADLRRGGFIADRYFSEEEDVSGDEDRRHQATPGESEFYLGASFSRRNPSMPEDLLDFHDEEEASCSTDSSLRRRRRRRPHGRRRPTPPTQELSMMMQFDARFVEEGPSQPRGSEEFSPAVPNESDTMDRDAQTAWAAPLDLHGVEQFDPRRESWRKLLLFLPSDPQVLCSLRAASRHVRTCVETQWWNAQVQLAKSFVDQHVAAFCGPDVGGHEEEQEAFARQMLLWVRPLLVNQPWRAETSGLAGVTGEDVTPQAAYISLRGAMINLSHPELPSKRLVFVGVIHTHTVVNEIPLVQNLNLLDDDGPLETGQFVFIFMLFVVKVPTIWDQ